MAAGDEITGVNGRSIKGKTKVEVAKMIQEVKVRWLWEQLETCSGVRDIGCQVPAEPPRLSGGLAGLGFTAYCLYSIMRDTLGLLDPWVSLSSQRC